MALIRIGLGRPHRPRDVTSLLLPINNNIKPSHQIN